VSGCAGDTRDIRIQHFWGFSFYRPAIFWISTLPPLDGKRPLSNVSTVMETFGAGVTKI